MCTHTKRSPTEIWRISLERVYTNSSCPKSKFCSLSSGRGSSIKKIERINKWVWKTNLQTETNKKNITKWPFKYDFKMTLYLWFWLYLPIINDWLLSDLLIVNFLLRKISHIKNSSVAWWKEINKWSEVRFENWNEINKWSELRFENWIDERSKMRLEDG